MYRFIFTVFLLFIFITATALPLPIPAVRASQSEANFELLQGYLDAAPDGMDVRYAWTLAGGKAENVGIIDIEVNWNLRHNDLVTPTANPLLFVEGFDPHPELTKDHGAAVLGELIAADDGIGVTGIAPRAHIGLINPLPQQGSVSQIAAAINQAARALQAGDILLIEDQSAKGPRLNPQTGTGLLPIEYEQDVYTAIKDATDRGIVVIEPAGNGAENLDDPIYNNLFNRNRDSGAILVGAGFPPVNFFARGTNLSATDESNYGSRVDVQGWGRGIVTCGFGDLQNSDGENNFYTSKFGGTSGASAMVAGAAAVLQSIIKQRGLQPLTSQQMRSLFRSTGTLQTGNKVIGPRPDLRKAIAALESTDQPPRITFVKFKPGAGKLIVEGENFIPGDAVIEVNGVAVAKMKYPAEFFLPNGTTTYLLAKGQTTSTVPGGVDLSITVYNRSKDRRSEPVIYRY
ncbi:MAG: S8 family serine peptidase [Acidobacteriota bacterium]